MVNPFHPETPEYSLTSNLIEIIDNIEEYIKETPAGGCEINPEIILQIIKEGGKHHKEILRGE